MSKEGQIAPDMQSIIDKNLRYVAYAMALEKIMYEKELERVKKDHDQRITMLQSLLIAGGPENLDISQEMKKMFKD